MRYYCPSSELLNLKDGEYLELVRKWENWNSHTHCQWECTLSQLSWKTFWNYQQKLNKFVPHDPAISLLRIYRTKMNAHVHQDMQNNIYSSNLFSSPKSKTILISINTMDTQIEEQPYNAILAMKMSELQTTQSNISQTKYAQSNPDTPEQIV